MVNVKQSNWEAIATNACREKENQFLKRNLAVTYTISHPNIFKLLHIQKNNWWSWSYENICSLNWYSNWSTLTNLEFISFLTYFVNNSCNRHKLKEYFGHPQAQQGNQLNKKDLTLHNKFMSRVQLSSFKQSPSFKLQF